MELSTVFLIGLGIVLVATLIGVLIKPTMIDEDSRLFGAWIGFCLGVVLGGGTVLVLILSHFLARFW